MIQENTSEKEDKTKYSAHRTDLVARISVGGSLFLWGSVVGFTFAPFDSPVFEYLVGSSIGITCGGLYLLGSAFVKQRRTRKQAWYQNHRALEKRIEEENKKLAEKGRAVELFTGNLEEFERLKGEEYEIIDISGLKKFIDLGPGRTERDYVCLGRLGAEALIGYHHVTYYGDRGIPVRRKK